jgi:two-component system, chemotaxis family, response regulator Rcp1
MTSQRPIEVLLVEDNPADTRMIREALEAGAVAKNFHAVTNGESAISYLRREGDFRGAARPDLVLLDLKLSGKTGLDVLRDIKTDNELKSIPVIVLTASEAEKQIMAVYNHQANCFVLKPENAKGYQDLAASIEDFWMITARLPYREK